MDTFEDVVGDLKAFVTRLEGTKTVQTAETEVKAIGSAALSYISANGLKDLYAIAMSALSGAATGTAPEAIAATVLSQGEAAGIAIAKGAEQVVIAQAQADLAATTLGAAS